MVVSSTSMKVGTTTASAISYGLKTRGLPGAKGADMAGDSPLMAWGWRVHQAGLVPEETCRRSGRWAQFSIPPSALPRGRRKAVACQDRRSSRPFAPTIAAPLLRNCPSRSGAASKGQRGASTHGETRYASLEDPFAAIHVDLQVYALADVQVS
jgi:hypothetical protein